MSEHIEMKTGTQVSEVVDRLARTMGEESICLQSEKSVAEGEWVRFNVQLEDGTPVLEGVGRCTGAQVRGPKADHYDLHLGDLSFDERNEIMFERMLIAKDASAHGDDTGTIQLPEGDMESVSAPDPVTEASPTRSVPPPPPAGALKASAPPLPRKVSSSTSKRLAKESGGEVEPKNPPTRTGTAPKTKTPEPTAKKRASVAPKKRASVAPKKRTSVAPKKRASVAPEKRASVAPKKRTSVAPEKRASVAPKNADTSQTQAPDGATRVDLRAPDASASPRTLAVSEAQRAQARALAITMPESTLASTRDETDVEAVLRKALAVGLAALEALEND